MRTIRQPFTPQADGARNLYESLKSQYRGAIITQSYLRCEKQLAITAANNISFDILANQGTAATVERRLQITDRFAVTAISVMLYNATAVSSVIAPADRSQAKLYSWNSPAKFTTANALTLESIYNGYLQAKVDGVTYIDSLDCRRFTVCRFPNKEPL